MGEKLTVSARVRSIDLAKSIAIACVVLIHVASGPLLWEAPNTGRWMQSLLWGSASRFAVPLFFLCSGALLLGQPCGFPGAPEILRKAVHSLTSCKKHTISRPICHARFCCTQKIPRLQRNRGI